MKRVLNFLVTILFGFIYYYIALPPLNFQSEEFYFFLISLCAVYIVTSVFTGIPKIVVNNGGGYLKYLKNNSKIPLIIIAVLLLVTIVGDLTGAHIFRAKDYRNLLTVTNGDFVTDIKEISFDKIPMLDRNSAIMLGDRKLGELSDMVSQFEVAGNYTQINYKDRPVRVTPLIYGDIIKWIANQSKGIPAYIVLDMASQEVDVVRLENGIKYSEAEHFNRNIRRHIRFSYPTYIFDEPTFEIDEEGVPYWICPKIVKKIGLFSGTDIEGAVLVNAITGESKYYADVPNWVDRLYNSDLIVQQYNYYGQYVHGFLNSMFGQKDVTVTTEGYNYIVLNDDVYLYTGITSVGGDASNIGFILSNQRTKETKFYSCAGATEKSATASAEGIVQHLGYKATFPLLLNISDQPTYFVALKDKANLVKMYAMVNVGQYQLVATGNTVLECEQEYIKLLKEKNMTTEEVITGTKITGVIEDIRTAVKEGNTHYYIKLKDNNNYFTISAVNYEPVVTLDVLDTITIEYLENENNNGIYSIYNLTI